MRGGQLREDNPKVSIIIPVYNGGNYLNEAINSALAQTYTNTEVIVINDGSNDSGATERLALSFGVRIKYYFKENGGVASALNFGIEKMSGDYFSWLSHDDLYTPDKVEKQVEVLRSAPDLAIAFSDFYTFEASRETPIHNKIPIKAPVRRVLAVDTTSTLHGCSLLVHKQLFDKYGVFDESLKCTQDYDLWFRFSNHVEFVHVEKPLVLSRLHDAQDSRSKLELCTIEGDALHHRFLAEMSADEIDAYFANDVQTLIRECYTYKNAGYYKTSILLLSHVYRMSKEPIGKLSMLLNDTIFNFDINDGEKLSYNLAVSIPAVKCAIKSKKLILVYTNVWYRGGVERVLSIILNGVKDDYSVVLVSSDENLGEGFFVDTEIRHIKISWKNSDMIAYRLAALAFLLEADLFVGNPNHEEPFIRVYKLLHDLGIKSVACNHGDYFMPCYIKRLAPLWTQRIEAYKYANAVTWATSFSARLYATKHENSVWMPNPNTFQPIDKPIERQEGSKKILCVGRFHDSLKRIDRILTVFSMTVKKHPDAELILVGGYDLGLHIPYSSKENVQQIIERLNLPMNQISFEGEQDDVSPYYREADVLFLASESEGFAMVLNEAGCHGLPSILFKIPGLEDIVTHGENGFIVEQGDLQGMADSISKVLVDNDLKLDMGKKALKMAERFNKDVVIARWKMLLETFIRDKELYQLENPLGGQHHADNFYITATKAYEKNIAVMLTQKEEPQPIVHRSANQETIDELQKTIDILHNSTSWKITHPLRVLVRLLRRRKTL